MTHALSTHSQAEKLSSQFASRSFDMLKNKCKSKHLSVEHFKTIAWIRQLVSFINKNVYVEEV